MITVGVFGQASDAEVVALTSRLTNRGATVVPIDLSRFPEETKVTISHQNIEVNGVPLLNLDAAFLRSRGVTVPPYIDFEKKQTVPSPEKWQSLYAGYCLYLGQELQHQHLRNALLDIFARARPLVNPVKQNDLHRLKTGLLWYLKKKGLPVPDFMAGTDRQKLRSFAELASAKANGAVIKPLAGIYKTHLWDATRWAEHRWDKQGALYQTYIKGDTIRCYVINGELVAAARIVHQGTVDSSMSQTGIEVFDLPPEACRIALAAARVLGLGFCGMDLMREQGSGAYYLIDCNMSPMFVNFSLLSGIDIPALLADFLVRLSQKNKPRKKRALSLLEEAKDILVHDPDVRQRFSREKNR
jgi:hypothetical protein